MRRWDRRYVHRLRRGSAERERKRLHARIEKRDRELPIGDGLRLPDQLIAPLFRNRAMALVVYINSVRSAGRLSIDAHAKSHGSAPRCRPHDEMQIAGVKTVRDAPMGLVQHNGLVLDRPLPCKRPGSCWIPGSWMCRGCPTVLLSPFPP